MSNNVFIDEFTTVIPQHRVPLASDDKVEKALARVDAVFLSYFDNIKGQALVDPDWIEDCVLEFGDWIASRIPKMNESRISRKFPQSVVLHDYASICVQEYLEDCDESLAQTMVPANAPLLASALCDSIMMMPNPLHIVVDSPAMSDPYEIDFPACTPEEVALLEDIDSLESTDQLGENASYRVLLRQALFASALECMSVPCATIAVAVDGEAQEGVDADFLVGAYLFSNGHFVGLGDEDMMVLLSKIHEHSEDTSNVNIEINAAYESFLADAVNSLARAVSTLMVATTVASGKESIVPGVVTFPSLVDVSDSDPAELFTDSVETQSVILGNGTAIVPFEVIHDEPLPRVFESVHATTLKGATDEACSFTLAVCTMRSAIMMMEDDRFDRIADMVQDLGGFFELSCDKYDLDYNAIAPIMDYCYNLDGRKHEQLFLEVYAGMEDTAKEEVDAIVESVDAKKSYTRKVVTLEFLDNEKDPSDKTWEDQLFGGSALSAHVVAFPSFVSDEDDMLKAMCTKCMCSSKPATMLFAFEDESGRLSQIGAIAWENGKWTNINKDHIDAIVMGSNISQILNFDPNGGFDYYHFEHKSDS